MDKKQVIAWLVPVISRGLAWIFAAQLGITATESQTLATQAGSAIGALMLVGVSVYTSIKGRKKLAEMPAKE